MKGLIVSFLLPALKRAFKEDEFRAILVEAIAKALQESVLISGLTSKANKYIGIANEKYDSLGPLGFYLKGYVLGKLEEFAESQPKVALALNKLGEPYVKAVLDGIDPDELSQATKPVVDVLFNKAIESADLLIPDTVVR